MVRIVFLNEEREGVERISGKYVFEEGMVRVEVLLRRDV